MSSKTKTKAGTKHSQPQNRQAGPQAGRRAVPLWVWGLALAVLVFVGAAVILQLTQNQAAAPGGAPAAAALPAEISITQAAEKRDQGAFILDVREQSEWDEYHIPGATLIPLGELPNRINEVPQDQEVVVVCRSGNRSQAGRDILTRAGFTQVTSMAGGVQQWQAQGLPIQTGP